MATIKARYATRHAEAIKRETHSSLSGNLEENKMRNKYEKSLIGQFTIIFAIKNRQPKMERLPPRVYVGVNCCREPLRGLRLQLRRSKDEQIGHQSEAIKDEP